MNEIKEIKLVTSKEELEKVMLEYEAEGINTVQLYSVPDDIFAQKQKNEKVEDGITMLGYEACIVTYLANMPPFGVHALWCESLDELLERMKSDDNINK